MNSGPDGPHRGGPRRTAAPFCLPVAIAFLAVLTTADPGYTEPRAHPELSARMAAIRTVGLVPPFVTVSEISAGGVVELRDDWTAAAKAHVTDAFLASFKGRSLAIRPIAADNVMKEELDDVMALYRAVVSEFFAHSEGQDAFPVKKPFSDLTLGDLGKIADAAGVDALLVVYGRDRISTGGRKALGTVALLAGVVFLPGGSGMNVGLVDRSGTLLWLNSDWSAAGADFRDAGSVSVFVGKILSDFPGGRK